MEAVRVLKQLKGIFFILVLFIACRGVLKNHLEIDYCILSTYV